jgi:steroid delta-isomerase-like uncharacterized protein
MTHLEILERALERFADPARREEYFNLYSDDIVLHGYQGVDPGLAGVRQFYAVLWAAFPDARVRVEDVLEAGDKLAVRFVMTATHQGPFLGVPATGRAVQLPGITILRFAGDKCVERWSTADFLAVLAQIGAWPPSAA